MKRRNPINTPLHSVVLYPSGVFSLEWDETVPYERFAFNVLSIGIHVLNSQQLPESITVDLTGAASTGPGWALNASVRAVRAADGSLARFTIATPELFPSLVYLFTAVVVRPFFEDANVTAFQTGEMRVETIVQQFLDAAGAAVRTLKTDGLPYAIRAAYDHLELDTYDAHKCLDEYDLLTKMIAYHEMAHAYVDQSSRKCTADEQLAYELIADLQSTYWLYGKMIACTPDSSDYRSFKGVATHEDAIYDNCLMCIRAQLSWLMLAAIAGAQRTGGPVSLAGGATHPPGSLRYMVQHMFLNHLIAEHDSATLGRGKLTNLVAEWKMRMDLMSRGGMIPDMDLVHGTSSAQVLSTAVNIIEEIHLVGLEDHVEYLKDLQKVVIADEV